jgi:hypothetical protein
MRHRGCGTTHKPPFTSMGGGGRGHAQLSGWNRRRRGSMYAWSRTLTASMAAYADPRRDEGGTQQSARAVVTTLWLAMPTLIQRSRSCACYCPVNCKRFGACLQKFAPARWKGQGRPYVGPSVCGAWRHAVAIVRGAKKNNAKQRRLIAKLGFAKWSQLCS